MKYSNLGKTGLKVSNLSLGTMAFGRWIDEQKSADILDAALESGINVVDTANFYGKGQDETVKIGTGESETIIGRALKGRRHNVVLATKVGLPMGRGINDRGLSRFHIMREVEQSLQRLQTDYIDLYQVHRFDEQTPLDETLTALNDLVRQGKVRYIGCSNFAAWQMAKADGISDMLRLEHFVSAQSQYNLLSRELEKEAIPFCRSENVGLLVYSPMARGMLSGKYTSADDLPEGSRAALGEELIRQYFTDENFEQIASYRRLAEAHNINLSQFSLAWVLNQPGVTSAIIGASKVHHVTDAVAISDWRWPEDLQQQVR